MLSTSQVQFMRDPNIGRLLANRYQLQELIGTGAMGKVYRANDTLLGGVPVAVKFLAISTQNKKLQVQQRFEREAKTCALLGQKSIHIVRVMDYGVDELNTPFYVMEYLQGKSLSDLIHLESLSLPRFLSLVRQICLGLQCAHQGIPVAGEIYPIVHRDVKPSNMLVIQDPSFGELVKVLDFGIAKLLQADSTQTSYYMGTWAYSSPEQMEGKELDHRSDIYSLGVMMFEMLTGKFPIHPEVNSFGGWYEAHHLQPPRSFTRVAPRLELPPELQNIVLHCLAKKQSDRPQSISEILPILISLEQRYNSASVAESSGKTVVKQMLTPTVKVEKRSLQEHEICRSTAWPEDKPIADIVFAHTLDTADGVTAALWVMLPQQEIQKRLLCKRYNQFLFIASPHPTILWITVLYSHEHAPKWLPYYLDLKTSGGEEITRLLGEQGSYKVLLFARESPQKASSCLSLNIAPAQTQLLQQWFINSQALVSTADPQLSKSLLKKEFEKLKPKILTKLEASTAVSN